MTARLAIEIETRPFERIQAQIAVAGVFEDVRPLRGSAARADWRLCGLISHLVQTRRMTGARGDAVLVPTSGRLRAGRVLLVGVGARGDRSALEVQDLVRDAMARVCALGLTDVALSPLGFAGDEWSLRAQPVIEGAREGCAGASSPIGLRLVVSSQAEARARASVAASIDALGDSRVHLVRRDGRDAPDSASAPRRSPQGHPGAYRNP